MLILSTRLDFPANVSEDFAKAQNIGENVNPHSSVNHSVPASNLLDLLRGSQENSNAAARAEARSLGSIFVLCYFHGDHKLVFLVEFVTKMITIIIYLEEWGKGEGNLSV